MIETAHARGPTWRGSTPAIRRSTAPIAEQMRRLDALGIAYDVTPGVPALPPPPRRCQRS